MVEGIAEGCGGGSGGRKVESSFFSVRFYCSTVVCVPSSYIELIEELTDLYSSHDFLVKIDRASSWGRRETLYLAFLFCFIVWS